MNKKWLGYVLASSLTLCAVAAVNTPVFAATKDNVGENTIVQRTNHYKDVVQLDAETQEKVDAVMNEAKTKLEKLGVEFPEKKDHPFHNLTQEQKEQFHSIMEQVKDGSLTKEEAYTKLKEQGINLPKKMHKHPFSNLTEEQKEQAKKIMNQIKEGSITKEEGIAKLKEMGITLPERESRLLQGLTDEQKVEARAILQETKEKVEDLGGNFHHEKHKHFVQS
ncbi:hypothetical protein [Priestia flexa]|uniref:hypothetical protein n=1 Tax=Priestia flexa TaxID=86664 RepID=UPI0010FC1DE6|nr:hypothetical protein [Priestia flexa]QCS54543.1 hypothetical protein FED53_19220 [Priestia flexa]